MIVLQEVTLDVAGASEASILAHLLEFYVHDLSALFAIDIGVDGRFGYERLPLYWSEPDTHFAFFVRVGGQLAGFALATRGSPATHDPEDLDVAEFFILRSYRRARVGRRAAFLLWNVLPGRWVVRVAAANHAGLAFWESTIRDYTGGAFDKTQQPGKHHTFHVFTFTTVPPVAVA
jgi:predicted acetyltransferase